MEVYKKSIMTDSFNIILIYYFEISGLILVYYIVFLPQKCVTFIMIIGKVIEYNLSKMVDYNFRFFLTTIYGILFSLYIFPSNYF